MCITKRNNMIHQNTAISQESLCFSSGDVVIYNDLNILRSLYHIAVRIISRVWGLKETNIHLFYGLSALMIGILKTYFLNP